MKHLSTYPWRLVAIGISVCMPSLAENASFVSDDDALVWVIPENWEFTKPKLPMSLARAVKSGTRGEVACTLGIDRNSLPPDLSDDVEVRGYTGAWHLRQAKQIGAENLRLDRHTFTRLSGRHASMAELSYSIRRPDRLRDYSAITISSPRGTDLINFNCIVPQQAYANLRSELLEVSAGVTIGVSRQQPHEGIN